METETEKWRTISEFPNYVISNKRRVANKTTGVLIGKSGKRVKLGEKHLTISSIYFNAWLKDKARKIPSFTGYSILQDGTVLNPWGKELNTVNGLVRIIDNKGNRMAFTPEKLKRMVWKK